MNWLRDHARSIELAVAGILTAFLVGLHFIVLTHAGPLWRDEISSLRLATMPTLSDLWSSLVYDPVPVLFFCLVRLWHAIGWGGHDQGLRLLGFLIGTVLLAVIWWNAWSVQKRPPLWTLLLFGLSPITLEWGDSLRAYGLSCLWNILAIGCVYRLLQEKPRTAQIAFATIVAILSVQTLFPNAFFLFAMCAAAILVAVRRRWWRTVSIVTGIGVISALSLLPYIKIVGRTREWSALCRTGIDLPGILNMLHRAIGAGGGLATTLWIVAAAATLLTLSLAWIRPTLPEHADRLLFAGATLLIAFVSTICFFRVLGWSTSVWYYLPLMGTAAVCIELILSTWRSTASGSVAISFLVLGSTIFLGPQSYRQAQSRMTNVDLIANRIAESAGDSDLVVVDNFFYAVSFQRYYHGKAKWLCVPEIADSTLHRWDLLKAAMMKPEPLHNVLATIDETLRTGNTLFLVGTVPIGKKVHPVQYLPPAPSSRGWILGPYIVHWTFEVAYAVQTHASHAYALPLLSKQAVNDVEQIQVVQIFGWKEASAYQSPNVPSTILTSIWDNWIKPNASSQLGPDTRIRVNPNQFSLITSDGRYSLSDEKDSDVPSLLP